MNETLKPSTPEHNHMYQIIGGKAVEVVRHGDELLPITDNRLSQIVGQQILELGD
jgi:hypothetical protein